MPIVFNSGSTEYHMDEFRPHWMVSPNLYGQDVFHYKHVILIIITL